MWEKEKMLVIDQPLLFSSHLFQRASFPESLKPGIVWYRLTNIPDEESFGKHCGKMRKCWYSAFSLFPMMFLTPPFGQKASLGQLSNLQLHVL